MSKPNHAVFDAFNVWRKNGVGDPMPNITNAQFQQVGHGARWWKGMLFARMGLPGGASHRP